MSPRMWRSERWATRNRGARQVDPHVVAEEQQAGLDPEGVGQPQQQREDGAQREAPLQALSSTGCGGPASGWPGGARAPGAP